jgi:hypothetical protein
LLYALVRYLHCWWWGRLVRPATSAAADDVAAVAAAAVWPPRSRFRYALNEPRLQAFHQRHRMDRLI